IDVAARRIVRSFRTSGRLTQMSADGSRALLALHGDPPGEQCWDSSVLGYIVVNTKSGAVVRKEQDTTQKEPPRDCRAAAPDNHGNSVLALSPDGKTVYRHKFDQLDAIDLASGKMGRSCAGPSHRAGQKRRPRPRSSR